jgi:hypothetical protein
MQLKAGYIIDPLASMVEGLQKEFFIKGDKTKEKRHIEIRDLYEHLTSFNIDTPFETAIQKDKNSVFCVISNIISRGLPTKAPLIVEEAFANAKITEQDEASLEKGEISFKWRDNNSAIDIDLFFELLHLVEPSLEIDSSTYGGKPGSKLELNFIAKNPIFYQLLDSQRDFTTINAILGGGRTVDFCFTLPQKKWDDNRQAYTSNGLIFEVDGPHHNLREYQLYDTLRDRLAYENYYETLRFSDCEINPSKGGIEELATHPAFTYYAKNLKRNIRECLLQYSLIYIPLSVARIEKTVIEIFHQKPELLSREKIKLAVIERDFPCAAMAIEHLRQLNHHLNTLLEAESLALPEIQLDIFRDNDDWSYSQEFHLGFQVKAEEQFDEEQYDIVLDHSILRRSNTYKENTFKSMGGIIKVRSSHYNDESYESIRRVQCSYPLKYKELTKRQDDGSFSDLAEVDEKALTFFLSEIFRKAAFREGQIPVISKALRREPVIGLLPTGGGKSITFQLPTFLQPGLCLVVDPIKSLMEDQVRVLNENWIDTCTFINSSLSPKEKKKRFIELMYGQNLFTFVSPERFSMQEFRAITTGIDQSPFDLSFSYCVIDEIHCLSEWGHDFRFTYLMLGANAQKHVKAKNGNIAIIGLTATASFDVLADVERELSAFQEDQSIEIVSIENTIRPEIFFKVLDVGGKNRIAELNQELTRLGNHIEEIQVKFDDSFKHHLNNFNEEENSKINHLHSNNAIAAYKEGAFNSITFCPYKGLNGNPFGVNTVFAGIAGEPKGFYYASDNNNAIEAIVHDHFLKFVNGGTRHMVCTKAFGMGIDKRDVRATYHYVYSGSLESLVQECGRSGRDRKVSLASILVSSEEKYYFDVHAFFKEYHHENFIKWNIWTRRAIRGNFDIQFINNTPYPILFDDLPSLEKRIKLDGDVFPEGLAAVAIDQIRTWMLESDRDENNGRGSTQYRFIKKKYEDRHVHDYFHNAAFKGREIEKSQIRALFDAPELPLKPEADELLSNAETLRHSFNTAKNGTFTYYLSFSKEYKNAATEVCNLLDIDPNEILYGDTTMIATIARNLQYSKGLYDFMLLINESGICDLDFVLARQAELQEIYFRDRGENDTGRLIYRMHCMGLVEDYETDYNTKVYTLTICRKTDIKYYTKKIENYLRRYLSENSTRDQLHILEQRIKDLKPTSLVDQLIEYMYFLTDFSYEQIVFKRNQGVDDVEEILIRSIQQDDLKGEENWYEQNLYIKEEIYYNFNAKYAREKFKILGKPYSLLDDYREYREKSAGKSSMVFQKEILSKYLGVFLLSKTHQNEYKHMVGSCRKVERRLLGKEDINADWALKLLKAFSLYCQGSAYKTREAHGILINGMQILFDKMSSLEDLKEVESVISLFFAKLIGQLTESNPVINQIKLLEGKFYFDLNAKYIDLLHTKFINRQYVRG